VVRGLIASDEVALRALAAAEIEIQQGADVESWKEQLLALGVQEADFSGLKQVRSPPASPSKTPFRTFKGPDGFTILVGRNSHENDQLSTRVARANDIWMHSRGTPGAHVVVQCGNKEPSKETLQLAANLTIFYSAATDSRKAAVLVARAKDVVKFKGAALGAVHVRREEPSLMGYPADVPQQCKQA